MFKIISIKRLDELLKAETMLRERDVETSKLQQRLDAALAKLDKYTDIPDNHVAVNWKRLKPHSIERLECGKKTTVAYYAEGAVEPIETTFVCSVAEHIRLKEEFEEWAKKDKL